MPSWAMGIVYAIPAVSMIISAQFWSKTGKKIGFVKVLKSATIILGVIYIFLGLWNNVVWFCLLFFAFGLFLAAMRTNITARTVDEIEADHRGRVLSVQDSFMTFGGALAPFTIGLIAKSYSTNLAFVIMGVSILVLSVICFSLLKNK